MRPGLGWPRFKLFHCLPSSAWAYGNLTEVAVQQLGKMAEHPNQGKQTQVSEQMHHPVLYSVLYKNYNLKLPYPSICSPNSTDPTVLGRREREWREDRRAKRPNAGKRASPAACRRQAGSWGRKGERKRESCSRSRSVNHSDQDKTKWPWNPKTFANLHFLKQKNLHRRSLSMCHFCSKTSTCINR